MARRVPLAIAHDYLTQRGGAERVVLTMLKAFPEAPLYTTLYDPEGTFPEFAGARVHTTWLNRIPALRRDHRLALPLLARAVDTAPIEADVVLASTTGWAHGFPTTGFRIAYCHSPARYLYLPEQYLGQAPAWSPQRLVLTALRRRLIGWDQRAAAGVDEFLCNSSTIAQRIADVYGRLATVVPPPAGVAAAGPQRRPEALADWDEFLLVVSRLLPYKNVDRVIEACRGADERLVVVGRGPLLEELRVDLPGNVRILPGLDDSELRWCYAHAQALVAASHEDYGLSPLEAGAFGKPVLALRAGGYLDTVAEGVNGYFFDVPDATEIRRTIVRIRDYPLPEERIRSHLEKFSEARFIRDLQHIVGRHLR